MKWELSYKRKMLNAEKIEFLKYKEIQILKKKFG